MKLAHPRWQQWLAAIIIATVLVYLGNRLWTHRDITWNWKEEVQLADGSRVWIERERIIGTHGGGEPFTSSRGPKSGRIIIPGKQGEVVWDFPLEPMVLERGVAPDRWVVIAIPRSCEDISKYGSPKPPYIQFDYINGKWTHKHVDSKWYDRRANLLGDYSRTYERRADYVGKSLTADQVKKSNDRIYEITKEQIVVDANYKPNCY